MQSLQQRLFGIKPTTIRVDRYELIGRIGEGATGVVYAARDSQVDRHVALKVINRDAGDRTRSDEHYERIRKEASTLANLSHPNLVRVYDVGQSEGCCYIAMELVDGGDLRRWLSTQPRSWPEIVDRIVQAARGLAAAHDAGIVHRDVKPSNIFVADDGRVLVGDFGLAEVGLRAFDQSSVSAGFPLEEAATTVPTGPFTVAGTLGYMAPEQLFGEYVDARTDVFALCATLWEALYGQCPYPSKTLSMAMESSRAGAKGPVGARAGVPRWLRKVCLRGLARGRRQRWSSMHELVAALEGGRANDRRRWAARASGVVLLLITLAYLLIGS